MVLAGSQLISFLQPPKAGQELSHPVGDLHLQGDVGPQVRGPTPLSEWLPSPFPGHLSHFINPIWKGAMNELSDLRQATDPTKVRARENSQK